MPELFPDNSEQFKKRNAPLADRMRPEKFEDILGQQHLIGDEGPLRMFFESGEFPSMLFWGPPGVGKTTFAHVISQEADHNFRKLSAVDSGVKDLRKIIAEAEISIKKEKKILLFIDEIHRFNKSQQDALLHAVESGLIILIGATTENPSFEVNSALLSRCQVYRLKNLDDEHIQQLIEKALEEDAVLKEYSIKIEDWEFLINISGGDARNALNALELAFKYSSKKNEKDIVLTRKTFESALQQRTAYYDKKGESHFDTISAFIKTLRGSDPDASLFWLAKMLDAGEDPKFIARRLVIFASEDVGNADVYAITLAVSVFQAVNLIGMPECRINLAQAVTYLASCPKSNASYMAIKQAEVDVRRGQFGIVPLHLRNAPTKLMKQEGYGEGYSYPHDHPNQFVEENYFPENMPPKAYYKPGVNGKEAFFKDRLEKFWKNRK
jgi:putative ATPase